MRNHFLKTVALMLTLLVLLTACGGKTATQDGYNKEEKQVEKQEEKTEVKVEEKQEEKKEEVGEEAKPEEPVATEEYGDREFKMIAPVGVPTIGMLQMMKESAEIGGAKMSYESITATDTIAPKLISGEADFAVVPSNLTIKVYNKGAAYQYAGSTVWGILYLATSDDSVKSWQDLKGKTIALIGRGLTPDLTLRYLMQKNGLNPDTDVTLEYVSGASELAPLFISGKANIALLPEPMLTQVMTKKPESKVLYDIQEEWKTVTGGESYPQTAVMIKKEIIEKYPVLVESFLERLNASIEFAKENPKAAGDYMEEINPNLKAGVIAKAIPNCNLQYKQTADAKAALETYYMTLKEFGPEHIGGKMPDENFYYQK